MATRTSSSLRGARVFEYSKELAEDVLQEHFGIWSFRAPQERAIKATLAGHDSLTVMPTGAGKSLLFQFPAIYLREQCKKKNTSSNLSAVVFVVSPLLSLMNDQVKQLSSKGIQAVAINGNTTYADEHRALRAEFPIVYITPEKLQSWIPRIREMNAPGNVVLCFAIDECHCISSWGHNFRHSYRELSQLRVAFPNIPIMAMTATATRRVMDDVCANLGLIKPVVIKTSFDRPNIFYRVEVKGASPRDDLAKVFGTKSQRRTSSIVASRQKQRGRLLDGSSRQEFPAIVYCLSRRETEDLAEVLTRELKIKSAAYHAGLAADIRANVLDSFMCGDIQVVVATVAFGMGIHKSDVRCVVHYGIPGTLEAYYQETGRAGRDGKQSSAILFFRSGDFSRRRRLNAMSSESSAFAGARNVRTTEQGLSSLNNFLNTRSCRRKVLLQHFGETYERPASSKARCCDNCDNVSSASGASASMASDEVNQLVLKDSQLLLTAIEETDENFGADVVVSYLLASSNKRARVLERFSRARLRESKVYGRGTYRNAIYWKHLIAANVAAGLVRKDTFVSNGITCATYALTCNGRKYLRNPKQPAQVPMTKELQPLVLDILPGSVRKRAASSASRDGTSPGSVTDEKLVRQLVDARKKVRRHTCFAGDCVRVEVFSHFVKLCQRLRRSSALRHIWLSGTSHSWN